MSDLPRIDVLLTGRPPATIASGRGRYEHWFEDQAGAAAHYRPIDLTAGEALPHRAESDGWIISGSPQSVYDDLPWLQPARTGLAAAVAAGHPLLGVCFGHQLLAVALGGRVAPNPAGWEIGQVSITLTEAGRQAPIFQGFGSPFSAYATHGDAVLELPAGSELLARNDQGVQSFRAGAHAYGVQFHPEFTTQIARDYVNERRQHAVGEIVRPDEAGALTSRVLTQFIINEIGGAPNGPTAF